MNVSARSPKGRGWATTLVVGFLLGLVLSLAFYRNQWHVVAPNHFYAFQRDTESLLIGRLAYARQAGLFAAGGLMGTGPGKWGDEEWIEAQTAAYLNGQQVDGFETYNSHVGFQATTFAILDAAIGHPSAFNLRLFQAISALLAAGVYTLILLWLWREFGWLAAVGALGCVAISTWPTLIGGRMYFAFWAMYLPLVGPAAYLSSRSVSSPYVQRAAFGVVGASVFIKCLFNGYEYITTALLMMLTPFVYFAVRDEWGLRRLVARGLWAAGASLCAVLASMLVLIVQIGSVQGSVWNGVRHITSRFMLRSHGDPNAFGDVYRASLMADPLSVLNVYLVTPAVDLTLTWAGATHGLAVSFRSLILVILGATLVHQVYLRFAGADGPPTRKVTALAWATWFSMLAPLSWLVIFKAHSAIHTFLNPIVWYLPYLLLGSALVGAVTFELRDPLLACLKVARQRRGHAQSRRSRACRRHHDACDNPRAREWRNWQTRWT